MVGDIKNADVEDTLFEGASWLANYALWTLRYAAVISREVRGALLFLVASAAPNS